MDFTHMNREATLHFRDELRTARAAALRDAETYQEIVLTLERLGAYLFGTMANLGRYKNDIVKLAEHSPMASEVPSILPDLHASFVQKYEIVRKGRNAAVHEGAFARHLTVNAVELSLVLEEAIMHGYNRVGDFMVWNPACAFMWQPLSFIRQTMLANSFSHLPVPVSVDTTSEWRLVSDSELARYLRVDGEVFKGSACSEPSRSC